MIPDTQTDRLFTSLAATLAAVENGVIEEAEIEDRVVTDNGETSLTITIRKTVAPLLGPQDAS